MFRRFASFLASFKSISSITHSNLGMLSITQLAQSVNNSDGIGYVSYRNSSAVWQRKHQPRVFRMTIYEVLRTRLRHESESSEQPLEFSLVGKASRVTSTLLKQFFRSGRHSAATMLSLDDLNCRKVFDFISIYCHVKAILPRLFELQIVKLQEHIAMWGYPI